MLFFRLQKFHRLHLDISIASILFFFLDTSIYVNIYLFVRFVRDVYFCGSLDTHIYLCMYVLMYVPGV